MRLELSNLSDWLVCWELQLGMDRRGIGLKKPGEEERRRRDALAHMEPAAAGPQEEQRQKHACHFPI